MAFTAGDRVKVADQSSEYRRNRGTVKSVEGDLHQVQLEGHGCNGRVPLLTGQLKTDATALVVSYAQCTG